MLRCLDAVGPRRSSKWAPTRAISPGCWPTGPIAAGARVIAIDPSPQDALVALAEQHVGVELIRETSLDALPTISMPDVADHRRRPQLLHRVARSCADRGQPRDRRQAAAAAVSRRLLASRSARRLLRPRADSRRCTASRSSATGAGSPPMIRALTPDGLPYPRSAAREGGERNGVLTAVEDFVAADRSGCGFVVVPAFFGFGAVWHRDAPWADRRSRSSSTPRTANPLLARAGGEPGPAHRRGARAARCAVEGAASAARVRRGC